MVSEEAVDARWFAGVDWGSEQHEICVVDAKGERVAQARVDHSAAGLAELVAVLASVSGDRLDQVAVAIEQPRGPIVETLLEHQIAVFAINPKQTDRLRDQHSMGGAKDDRLDAFVIADALRTSRRLFRRLVLDAPKILALREWTRMHDELTTEKVRLSNRLREQMHRYYPQVLKLSEGADDAWVWDLLMRAPLPAQAQGLRPATITAILRAHRIRRIRADQVLAILREPALTVAPGAAQAASEHVHMLVPRLRLVHEQVRQCVHRLDELLGDPDLDEPSSEGGSGQDRLAPPANPEASEDTEDPRRPSPPRPTDAAILSSIPGAGRIVTATLLSEAASALRQRDLMALRTRCGTAPVTRKTGKQKRGHVHMRYACQTRLRDAVRHWSANHIQHDLRGRRHYDALRTCGHDHERALRGVADRLLSLLVAMLRDRTEYDAERRNPQPKEAANET